MSRILIVGAGISGLSLAYRLQQFMPGVEVQVVEQRDRPGGTCWTERRDGFQVEIGPNGFLDSKPSTVSLSRDVGLGERLIAASEVSARNRYLFLDGRLRPLPHSLLSFLGSDLLGWRGKVSFLMERFRRRASGSHDESIDAFARRRAGAEVADVFADALVTGIHAGDPTLLSIRAAFPRVAQLEEQYGSVMKGMAASARQRRADAAARGEVYQRPGKMWAFREGLRLLVETLRDRLARPPLTGVTVKRIERSTDAASTWIVHGDGQDHWHADVVVLTCPAYEQAALLADIDAELAERIAGIVYNRVAVVALGYRQADVPTALDGFGYIAPQRSRRDLLGVQWCSSIFPGRAPPGMVVMRALCGGWNRPDVPGWSDDRLLTAMRAELTLALSIRADPVFHHIVRWERAIPQYHLGHLERVAWIEQRVARHPGLILGGNAYYGVALNDCTEQAETLAARIKTILAK